MYKKVNIMLGRMLILLIIGNLLAVPFSILFAWYYCRVKLALSRVATILYALPTLVLSPAIVCILGLHPVYVFPEGDTSRSRGPNFVHIIGFEINLIPIRSKPLYLVRHLREDLEKVGFQIRPVIGVFGQSAIFFHPIAYQIVLDRGSEGSSQMIKQGAKTLFERVVPPQCGRVIDVDPRWVHTHILSENCLILEAFTEIPARWDGYPVSNILCGPEKFGFPYMDFHWGGFFSSFVPSLVALCEDQIEGHHMYYLSRSDAYIFYSSVAKWYQQNKLQLFMNSRTQN